MRTKLIFTFFIIGLLNILIGQDLFDRAKPLVYHHYQDNPILIEDMNGDNYSELLCGHGLYHGSPDGLYNQYSPVFQPTSMFTKFPRIIDMNDDGLKDFVFFDSRIWSVYYQESDNSYNKVDIPTNEMKFGRYFVGNINSGSEEEVILIDRDYFVWNIDFGGSSIEFSLIGITEQPDIAYDLMDVNGDGIDELVSFNQITKEIFYNDFISGEVDDTKHHMHTSVNDQIRISELYPGNIVILDHSFGPDIHLYQYKENELSEIFKSKKYLGLSFSTIVDWNDDKVGDLLIQFEKDTFINAVRYYYDGLMMFTKSSNELVFDTIVLNNFADRLFSNPHKKSQAFVEIGESLWQVDFDRDGFHLHNTINDLSQKLIPIGHTHSQEYIARSSCGTYYIAYDQFTMKAELISGPPYVSYLFGNSQNDDGTVFTIVNDKIIDSITLDLERKPKVTAPSVTDEYSRYFLDYDSDGWTDIILIRDDKVMVGLRKNDRVVYDTLINTNSTYRELLVEMDNNNDNVNEIYILIKRYNNSSSSVESTLYRINTGGKIDTIDFNHNLDSGIISNNFHFWYDINQDGVFDHLIKNTINNQSKLYVKYGIGDLSNFRDDTIQLPTDLTSIIAINDYNNDGSFDLLGKHDRFGEIACWVSQANSTQWIFHKINDPKSLSFYYVLLNEDINENGSTDLIYWDNHQISILSAKQYTSTDKASDHIEHILIYPNPTSDILFLPNIQEHFNYSIFDTSGNHYFDGITIKPGTIDISHLPPAVYILELRKDKTKRVSRFVKI